MRDDPFDADTAVAELADFGELFLGKVLGKVPAPFVSARVRSAAPRASMREYQTTKKRLGEK